MRLREGRREDATVYHERPWEVAEQFARDGATAIHVVDLDGAFAGEPRQLDAIARIAAASGLPVQAGGGVRDEAAIVRLLDAGATLVVLGTSAVRDPAFVERACRAHPGRVVVAVDARDGKVAVAGWTEATDVDATELAARAAAWGAAAILYTDIARDGLRTGPNVRATAELQLALGALPVIASGGISSLADLRALARAGVQRCVVGRALYDRDFTLAEALVAC